MGWSEYARSKVPLKLVFILMAAIAVNMMLLESFKILLLFDYTDPANQLTAQGHPYEGYTIADSYLDDDENRPPWENSFTVYLVENPEGVRELAVVENHVLFPRHRYMEKLSMTIPTDHESPVIGQNSGNIRFSCVLTPDGTIEYAHVNTNSGMTLPILLFPMLILEYIAFIFLFRRDEIL